MTALAKELLTELEAERRLYRLELAEDHRGLSLVACVRELDLLFDNVGLDASGRDAE